MAIHKVNMNGFSAAEVECLINVFDQACRFLQREPGTADDIAEAVMAEARLNGCDDPVAVFRRVIETCGDGAV